MKVVSKMKLLLAFGWLVLGAPAGRAADAGEPLVLNLNRLHLRAGDMAEWDEFAVEPAPARRLDLRFTGQANPRDATLFVRQDDVRQDWSVELNGRQLGTLFLMEADLVHTLRVPGGTLRDGDNLLSIVPPRENDDIVLHEIRLDPRSPAEAVPEATLEFQISDRATGRPVPCRITIVNRAGALAPLLAITNGLTDASPIAVRPGVIYTGDGRARVGLPAGDFTVYASRGFEWSVATQQVRLAVGDSRAVALTLEREVPTPGLVACDTHIHTLTHSRHGDATLDERMLTLAGEGIELPIATEHNLLADYSQAARRLGMDRWFTPVMGDEVTTAAGHFNVFPVEAGSRVPDFRLTDWPALMKSIRATPGVRVAVLNHPRNFHNGFQPFAATNFNGVSGENRRGPEFTFDAMELLNSSAQQTDYLLVYRDWFALLNHGYRVTAVGSSDGHDVSRYIVGQGRTYIACRDADPGRLDAAAACSSLLAGRALVSMGLLTKMTVNTNFTVGELVTEPGRQMQVNVRVLGPSWVHCTNVALFANGEKIRETQFNEADDVRRPLGERASVTWDIPRPAHDVHLVAIATGPGVTAPFWAIPRPYQPASPHWTGRVIGSANPIWVDADGDGEFTAARGYARKLVAQHGNNPKQLLDALRRFDEAVAAQAASLSVTNAAQEKAFARALESAAPQVRRGFAAYADARKDKVADTKFSQDRGLFTEPFELELRTKTEEAAIWFTTNGTVPSPTNGIGYLRPLTLTNTTVVRAAAFKAGLTPTDVDTQTYIFPGDVIRQTGVGFPKTWGVRDGKPVPADYEMDPESAATGADRVALESSLRTLPTLALTLDPADLFDPQRGLYANPMESGDAWERSASAEFLPADNTKGFQIDCGLRIQGGWNRRPEESPKHSLRLVFRKKYGAGRLKHPLFDGPPAEFETLILRGGNNHSWLHWSANERRSADYARDQWLRESYAAMGQPSARGRFVHLYLNGLYWGLYNLAERPDEHFAAARLGGSDKDYDARNADKVLSGDETVWKQLFTLENDGVAEPAKYAAVRELLELPAFCDYMLLNLYGANGDWDRSSNWYAARRRAPDGRYRFFVWDGERTLEGVNDSRLTDDDDLSPTRLFQKLRASQQFRREFADRARRHLTGDGALTPTAAAERYRRLAQQLEPAILAEAARWGDYRRDVHPYKEGPFERYTREEHWRPEVRRLLEDYFPQRTAVFWQQLQAVGLASQP